MMKTWYYFQVTKKNNCWPLDKAYTVLWKGYKHKLRDECCGNQRIYNVNILKPCTEKIEYTVDNTNEDKVMHVVAAADIAVIEDSDTWNNGIKDGLFLPCTFQKVSQRCFHLHRHSYWLSNKVLTPNWVLLGYHDWCPM